MEGIVNCVAYCDGNRVGNIEISRISEVLKQKDKFVWVGLHEPDEELLKQMQEEFGLHDLAMKTLTMHINVLSSNRMAIQSL